MEAGTAYVPYGNRYNAASRRSRASDFRRGGDNNNPAYMVTHVKVKDEEKWDEYRSQGPATLTEWGAEVVFRGKRAEVLTGDHEYTHTITTRFHDAATIRSWYGASPYQTLVPPRDQAVETALIGYDAFD